MTRYINYEMLDNYNMLNPPKKMWYSLKINVCWLHKHNQAMHVNLPNKKATAEFSYSVIMHSGWIIFV